MKTYFRKYVDYFQNDWSKWLLMTKYSSNAFFFSSTGIFFLVNYEFEPRLSFDPITKTDGTAKERILIKKAKNISDEMKKIWNFTKNNLVVTQKSQKRFVDVHKTKTPVYKIKNKIWLSTRNLKTEKSVKKLNHKMIDPFKIKKILKQNCQLKLPPLMKIHDIFHIFFLRRNLDDPLKKQMQSSSFSIIINDENEYEMND